MMQSVNRDFKKNWGTSVIRFCAGLPFLAERLSRVSRNVVGRRFTLWDIDSAAVRMVEGPAQGTAWGATECKRSDSVEGSRQAL